MLSRQPNYSWVTSVLPQITIEWQRPTHFLVSDQSCRSSVWSLWVKSVQKKTFGSVIRCFSWFVSCFEISQCPSDRGEQNLQEVWVRWLSSWWIVSRDSLQMSGRRAWLHPDSGDAEPALSTPSLGGGLLISLPLEADSPDVTSSFSTACCSLPSDDDQQSENFDVHF